MTDDGILVRCDGAGRTYGSGPAATVALQPTTCDVRFGARIAVMGQSGSGKSTLLHLMAGLDEPTVGSVSWPALGTRAALRPGPVAVVFQGPSLLPPLTVAENVALPLILDGVSNAEATGRAREALERIDVADVADKLPEEISGGQAQRAAVARAIAGRARLILADEPTGQLDHVSAASVIEALLDGAAHAEAALVVATHDPAVAERLADRWNMNNGRIETGAKQGAWSL
jgi:putative ABC transport system ATP-binding protein/lipoprotein-releasing system ATP-binding protein